MNELVQELGHSMLPHTLFSFTVFGFAVPITDTIITMWLIMVILIGMSLILSRKFEMVPSKVQNFGEILVDGIGGVVKSAMGHHWRAFTPYIGTILLFLVLSNVISIFNIIPNWPELSEITGIQSLNNMPEYFLRPPTKDINVTACMAIMTILLVIGSSIKYRKVKGFAKSFFEPVAFLFPFKILEYFIKPLSLCLRLFGNILAAFTIMELIYFAIRGLAKFIIPTIIPSVVGVYFDLFDGLLQAYIFAFLTALYVGEAIEEPE